MDNDLTYRKIVLSATSPTQAVLGIVVNHDKCTNYNIKVGNILYEFLTYQFQMVRYGLTVAMTGDGELGFDSGEEVGKPYLSHCLFLGLLIEAQSLCG